MTKIDAMLIGAKIKAASAKERLVERVKSAEFGDSQLVVALVLIAIALGLCFIFRDKIRELLTSLMTTLSKGVNDLSAGNVTKQVKH